MTMQFDDNQYVRLPVETSVCDLYAVLAASIWGCNIFWVSPCHRDIIFP